MWKWESKFTLQVQTWHFDFFLWKCVFNSMDININRKVVCIFLLSNCVWCIRLFYTLRAKMDASDGERRKYGRIIWHNLAATSLGLKSPSGSHAKRKNAISDYNIEKWQRFFLSYLEGFQYAKWKLIIS